MSVIPRQRCESILSIFHVNVDYLMSYTDLIELFIEELRSPKNVRCLFLPFTMHWLFHFYSSVLLFLTFFMPEAFSRQRRCYFFQVAAECNILSLLNLIISQVFSETFSLLYTNSFSLLCSRITLLAFQFECLPEITLILFELPSFLRFAKMKFTV